VLSGRALMAAGLALVDDVAQAWPRAKTPETAAPVRGRLGFPGPAGTDFIDREAELEAVLSGLSSPDGPRFWLVVAPPGLGKSKFLKTLKAELEVSSRGWEVRHADVRNLGKRIASEPAPLVANFFTAQELNDAVAPGVAERIANAILADGRSFLCVLDSAELLDERVVAGFREYFSEIYQYTGARTGEGVGRVALVVGSRLDAGWKGVLPAPRFWPLPLAAFSDDDIGEPLQKLARRMGKDLDRAEHEQAAAWLGDLSAGVPELLTSCLRWIETNGWPKLDRPASDDMFRKLGYDFVRNRLLSQASLLPSGMPDPDDKRRAVVEEALRLVAPYRIFGRSHLRQHLEPGCSLSRELASASWSLDDLWNALTRSALLGHPQKESWQVVQSAIRKLLFRYFYETDELRAGAQLEALRFDRTWSQGLIGSDQVAGLAECIWHEASALRIIDPGKLESSLLESATDLISTLRPAEDSEEDYSVDELRHQLAEKLRNDGDLAGLLSGAVGVRDRLIRVVESA
jgi:hypothetical protein